MGEPPSPLYVWGSHMEAAGERGLQPASNSAACLLTRGPCSGSRRGQGQAQGVSDVPADVTV